MNSTELDTQEAPNKWWASQDARMRNYAMASSYTDAQKLQAERMKLALEMVYSTRGVHINYRQRFIAVKVDQPQIRDRKTLVLLEKDWESAAVRKAVSNQGIVYRIPRV